MKPRAIEAPGAHYEFKHMHINHFSLSLLRLFKKQIPDVFSDEVMNPIGASTTWKWVPYTNAYVDIDGKRTTSVSRCAPAGAVGVSGSAPTTWPACACSGSAGAEWGDRRIVSPT